MYVFTSFVKTLVFLGYMVDIRGMMHGQEIFLLSKTSNRLWSTSTLLFGWYRVVSSRGKPAGAVHGPGTSN